ncbi:uncharacterized protein IUM83_14483 [Phytophthora cinnamomi]|uniref:uncharacterized protein n=1 Tax=Phytophthora cinnamomi TaxID=4785 RepID=UPI00355A7031|nr:hypothetical protein IUM83_14483 [Phytophthora cinnamomi]
MSTGISALALASLVFPATLTGTSKSLGRPGLPGLTSNPGWLALVDYYWDIRPGGDQCGKFKAMAAQKGPVDYSSCNGKCTLSFYC